MNPNGTDAGYLIKMFVYAQMRTALGFDAQTDRWLALPPAGFPPMHRVRSHGRPRTFRRKGRGACAPAADGGLAGAGQLE